MSQLHLSNGNKLYDKSGQEVKYNGYQIVKWSSDNTRWSACGKEIKELKGKTIIDLEKIYWYVLILLKDDEMSSFFAYYL